MGCQWLAISGKSVATLSGTLAAAEAHDQDDADDDKGRDAD